MQQELANDFLQRKWSPDCCSVQMVSFVRWWFYVLRKRLLTCPLLYSLDLVSAMLFSSFFLLLPHVALPLVYALPNDLTSGGPQPSPLRVVRISFLCQILIYTFQRGVREPADPHLTSPSLQSVLLLHSPGLWVDIDYPSCTMVCPHIDKKLQQTGIALSVL